MYGDKTEFEKKLDDARDIIETLSSAHEDEIEEKNDEIKDLENEVADLKQEVKDLQDTIDEHDRETAE